MFWIWVPGWIVKSGVGETVSFGLWVGHVEPGVRGAVVRSVVNGAVDIGHWKSEAVKMLDVWNFWIFFVGGTITQFPCEAFRTAMEWSLRRAHNVCQGTGFCIRTSQRFCIDTYSRNCSTQRRSSDTTVCFTKWFSNKNSHNSLKIFFVWRQWKIQWTFFCASWIKKQLNISIPTLNLTYMPQTQS